MKIAIMGSGGVGGYFGAKLALAGNDVTFVARGAHLDALRRDGLTVRTDSGELHVRPASATDDPATIGTVDMALFCTKLYDTVEAAEALKPAIGPDSFVVTLQNGVSGPDLIASVLGPDRVLGGSTHITSHLEGPGVVVQKGTFARIVFGELDGGMSERGRRFADACAAAGIEFSFTDRVTNTMWEKFMALAVMSGLNGVTRLPVGAILDDAALLDMTRKAVEEVVAVARAKGITLPDNAVEMVERGARLAPYGTKASMLVDLERGKKLELPWLSGAVAKFGAELGVPTPVHGFIATVLGPYANGAPA